MIDLTPLDVRNKRGDFKRILRGYDPQEVDTFLELVAERLESVVRENLGLHERTELLQRHVDSQSGREQAVQEALVTAQELRADIRDQARKEAEHILREGQTEARRLLAEAEAEVRTRARNAERSTDQAMATLGELERRRLRFLREFRQLLERELDVVGVEEERTPLEERPIDLDFGTGRTPGGSDVMEAADLAPDPAGPLFVMGAEASDVIDPSALEPDPPPVGDDLFHTLDGETGEPRTQD